MGTTAHRTNVHGRAKAAQEWRRIVDLAGRHGLAAAPSARPEFAGESVAPGNQGDPDRPDRRELAMRARRTLAEAETAELHVESLATPVADDALLLEIDGVPHFLCSSWSELAAVARRGAEAILVIDEPTDRPPVTRVALAGRLAAVRRDQVDGGWIELIALRCSTIAIEHPTPAGAQRELLPVDLYLDAPAS
jgi:hypothetical protein